MGEPMPPVLPDEHECDGQRNRQRARERPAMWNERTQINGRAIAPASTAAPDRSEEPVHEHVREVGQESARNTFCGRSAEGLLEAERRSKNSKANAAIAGCAGRARGRPRQRTFDPVRCRFTSPVNTRREPPQFSAKVLLSAPSGGSGDLEADLHGALLAAASSSSAFAPQRFLGARSSATLARATSISPAGSATSDKMMTWLRDLRRNRRAPRTRPGCRLRTSCARGPVVEAPRSATWLSSSTMSPPPSVTTTTIFPTPW